MDVPAAANVLGTLGAVSSQNMNFFCAIQLNPTGLLVRPSMYAPVADSL